MTRDNTSIDGMLEAIQEVIEIKNALEAATKEHGIDPNVAKAYALLSIKGEKVISFGDFLLSITTATEHIPSARLLLAVADYLDGMFEFMGRMHPTLGNAMKVNSAPKMEDVYNLTDKWREYAKKYIPNKETT